MVWVIICEIRRKVWVDQSWEADHVFNVELVHLLSRVRLHIEGTHFQLVFVKHLYILIFFHQFILVYCKIHCAQCFLEINFKFLHLILAFRNDHFYFKLIYHGLCWPFLWQNCNHCQFIPFYELELKAEFLFFWLIVNIDLLKSIFFDFESATFNRIIRILFFF